MWEVKIWHLKSVYVCVCVFLACMHVCGRAGMILCTQQCVTRANSLSVVKIFFVKYAKSCTYSKNLCSLISWVGGRHSDSLENKTLAFLSWN